MAEGDGLDECLEGPMTSFGLRSAPLSHLGDIDDDVGDDGNEWYDSAWIYQMCQKASWRNWGVHIHNKSTNRSY